MQNICMNSKLAFTGRVWVLKQASDLFNEHLVAGSPHALDASLCKQQAVEDRGGASTLPLVPQETHE